MRKKTAVQSIPGTAVPDGIIEEIFAEEGKKHGYKKVKAAFVPLKASEIRWSVSGHSLTLEISDYFRSSSDADIGELADCIFDSISASSGTGKRSYPAFSRERQFLRSEEIRQKNTPVKIEAGGC